MNKITEEQKQTRRDQKNGIARRNKKALVDYMGGKCCLCGFDKCLNSLDFHHVGQKNFSIGRNICRKIDSLMQECDLCVLLCKNCHYEVHDEKESLEFDEKLIEEMKAHKERSAGVKQIKALQTQIHKIETELGFKVRKIKRKSCGERGPMSEEQKAAISKTMKKQWAKKKLKTSSET